MGNRKQFLNKSIKLIAEHGGSIVKESSIYETAAWGNTKQAAFLNKVIIIRTKFSPDDLMKTLLHIETGLGRIRTEKYGPRTIDLDILFYGDEIVIGKELVIPHPGIAQRRFTLVPLVEIAAEFTHPVLGKNMSELLAECEDELVVKVYPKYAED